MIHVVKGYTAHCIISNRETINEDMVLEILRAVDPNLGCIKTKEYIDFDALERAIYNDQLDKDIIMKMDKARDSKEVVTLKITKKKGAKHD